MIPAGSSHRPCFPVWLSRRRWLEGAAALAAASLAPQLAGAEPKASREVARLSLNENPLGPSPKVVSAISRAMARLSRYTGQEAARLGQQIAAYEGVPAEQVVLGEVLEPLGLQLGLEGGPGAEFVHSVPGYNALVDAARPVGGVSVGVPLDDAGSNDLGALSAKITRRTRAVFLVNPHNPTGTVHDIATFRDFVRDVAKRTLVIVDEAYLEFMDDFGARSLRALVSANENVIVFRTFGKAYGLAGLQLGYVLAPRALALRLSRAGVGAPRSLNLLAVVAASAALGDQSFVSKVRTHVKAERAAWNSLLSELRLRQTHSHGNFVFFETGRPHADFAARMLAERVAIGRAFPPLDTWARVSIGLPDENRRARSAVKRVLAGS